MVSMVLLKAYFCKHVFFVDLLTEAQGFFLVIDHIISTILINMLITSRAELEPMSIIAIRCIFLFSLWGVSINSDYSILTIYLLYYP